jgi:cardiolipin synthase
MDFQKSIGNCKTGVYPFSVIFAFKNNTPFRYLNGSHEYSGVFDDKPLVKKMIERLKNDGVVAQEILPLRFPGRGYVRPDLRNHRKLVVIDGVTGYTGSQNIVQRNYHRRDNIYYDEVVARICGPAVLQLSAIFLTDWFSETGNLLDYNSANIMNTELQSYGDTKIQILPSGPGYEDENNL